jgi:hypothetical protein
MVDVLPAYRHHLNYYFISLRGEVWAHTTSLTVPLKSSLPSNFHKYQLFYFYYVFHIELSKEHCLIIFIIA